MVLPENSMKYIQGDLLEILADGGFERIGVALRILLNAAMLAEHEKFLGAAPHERSEARRGQANGFKDKTMNTRVGKLCLTCRRREMANFIPTAWKRDSAPKGHCGWLSPRCRHRDSVLVTSHQGQRALVPTSKLELVNRAE